MPSSEAVDELLALKELRESDGWAVFLKHVDQEWGAERCIEKIDDALKALPPGDYDAERQIVSQIRAAARQIQAVVRWPDEQITRLNPKKETAGRFDTIRRIAR